MKENTTYITTATIHFYEKLLMFPNSERYTWIIKLYDCSLSSKHNRIYVKLSDSYDESKEVVDILRRHLAQNHIFDGSKATIILQSGEICAIGTNGADNYCDTRDNLSQNHSRSLELILHNL